MEISKWGYKWKTSYPDGIEYQPKPLQISDEYLVKEGHDSFFLGNIKSTYTEPNKVGALTTILGFQYGTLEFKVRLPKGNNLNPFIHLKGGVNPNHTLKILDAYSKDRGNYGSFFYPYSTLGTGFISPDEKSTYPHKVWSNPIKNFMDIKVDWTPEKIDIYYNNSKVSKFTKKVIKNFNQPCQLILSSGIEPLSVFNTGSTEFVIKDMKYTPYE